MEKRREKEVAEMKDNILNAAVALIIAEGYEKLSMRKIAKEIGYSPTTLYLYFSDKADIIAAISQKIVSSTIQHSLNQFNEIKHKPEDIVLKEILCYTVITICSEPNLGIALIKSGENRIFTKTDQDGPLSATIFVQGILKHGVNNGVFKNVGPETASFLLISIIGFAQYCLENSVYTNDNFVSLTEGFVSTLIYGVC